MKQLQFFCDMCTLEVKDYDVNKRQYAQHGNDNCDLMVFLEKKGMIHFHKECFKSILEAINNAI
jgi:hypothetical protein